MNIEHLNEITPQFVESFERLEARTDPKNRSQVRYLKLILYARRYVIIAALHAALRVKKELEETTQA